MAPPTGKFQPASDTQQATQAKQGDDAKGETKSFASVRLGTDQSGKVLINDDQERQIGRALRAAHVHATDDVNINVKVGDVVPASVRLGAVSAGLVDVLPQFRGYSLFATSEQVFVVDPRNKTIVAMIPVKTTATAARPAPKPAARSDKPETTASARADDDERPAERTSTRKAAAPRIPRAPDLSSIEAAIERDIVRQRGTVGRGYRGGPSNRTVIIEGGPPGYYELDTD